MSDQSTNSAQRRYFRYPTGKRKRHLYLTEPAFQHLVDLADANGVYPSEVAEQIIRHHIAGMNIPDDRKPPFPLQLNHPYPIHHGLADPEPTPTDRRERNRELELHQPQQAC